MEIAVSQLLDAIAFCVAVFDSASLHYSFFSDPLAARSAVFDDAELALAVLIEAEAGGDEALILEAMQNGYSAAVALSGAEMLAAIETCQEDYGPLPPG